MLGCLHGRWSVKVLQNAKIGKLNLKCKAPVDVQLRLPDNAMLHNNLLLGTLLLLKIRCTNCGCVESMYVNTILQHMPK